MDAIDRRSALRALVCGTVSIGLSTSLLPELAEATPLAAQKDPGKNAGEFKLEVQGSGSRPPGSSPDRPPARPSRPPPHSHRRQSRRRRRWECWWHRGRRHCGWRWR